MPRILQFPLRLTPCILRQSTQRHNSKEPKCSVDIVDMVSQRENTDKTRQLDVALPPHSIMHALPGSIRRAQPHVPLLCPAVVGISWIHANSILALDCLEAVALITAVLRHVRFHCADLQLCIEIRAMYKKIKTIRIRGCLQETIHIRSTQRNSQVKYYFYYILVLSTIRYLK